MNPAVRLALACSACYCLGGQSSRAAEAQPPLPLAAVQAVNPARCEADVRELAGFGTRLTISDATDPKRGIGAARNWLKDQFESYGRVPGARPLTVRMESFIQTPTPNKRIARDTELVNVVAELPGKDPTIRYYVVGHYDSRNGDDQDAVGDAPGANDDASGTSVVLECARVLSQLPQLDATVVFLCTAGEEQGLLGAKYHADQAASRGERILGVLSNDIVGDPSCPDGVRPTVGGAKVIRLFSEGLPRNPDAMTLAEIRKLSMESDSPSRQLARFIAEVGRWTDAPTRPMLVFRPDRFLRGGDHSAFNEAGLPGVRFTEVDEDYSRQHQNVTMRDGKPYGDVPEFVDRDYLANVARLNAAALVYLANAPAPPANARVITAKLENTTTLRWQPSPGATGYQIVWRATTAPEWEHAKDVGEATEATLDQNKDDWFYGVRAYDAEGYRSVVSFAREGPR